MGMAEKALHRFPDKIVIFVAPKCPLAKQQMDVFIERFGVERVGGYFANANIIFFTPETLVQHLCKDTCHLTMERVSLLIVDECHHTRGASPLTKLADLYRCSDSKPRFLGLTALPVNHSDDSEAYILEPMDEIRHETSLHGLCSCWLAHIDTVEPGSEEDLEMLRDVPVPKIEPKILDSTSAASLKKELEALVARGVNPNADEYERTRILAMLSLVVGELRHNRDDNFRAIIFVHNRANAQFLLKIRQSRVDLANIHGHYLTGHNSKGTSQYKQKIVLDNFRRGSVKLLVATSVVEEGLNIKHCNLVIRLDAAVTDIGFVQSRGRARYPGAKYICTW